jgi:hypothetical protein
MSELRPWIKAENLTPGSAGDQSDIRADPSPPIEDFNLTSVESLSLDYSIPYPALAIRVSHIPALNIRAAIWPALLRKTNSLFNTNQIYVKDTSFLTADQDNRFKWIASHHCSFYRPDLVAKNPPDKRKRLTRYSYEEINEEDMDMIYPVRPFSITNIDLEGFDPSKEYPVLAIDMDKYLPEEEEGGVDQPEELQSETMAFFLVADDKGEFSWVAEDECKLFPLKV